ncbi:mobile mystery protein B [Bdellovibrionota bacterium FG-2]
MVGGFLFKDREGQTPLPPEFQKDLKPKHMQTMGELDEYEEQNIAEGLAWLKNQQEAGTTYDFWLKLHKKLFVDVWTWAGKVRIHELHNLDFHPPHQIWTALRQLEGDLAFWVNEKSFSEREITARFHERIETIHPFANGNGRFGRILVEHFCTRKGWKTPTWGNALRDKPKVRRSTYIAALDCARRKLDYEQLVEFMFS